MAKPIIQIAVDTVDLERAGGLIDAALGAGADWIELGKPLIEFHGIIGAAQLLDRCSAAYVLADLMIMAAPAKYLEAVAVRGIRNATVTALAPESTVVAAIDAGRRIGIDVTVDLFNVARPEELARRFSDAGAAYLMVHYGVDQKRADPNGTPLRTLERIASSVSTPISYATYDLAEARAAVDAGASVIVQGEPLLSDPHPEQAFSAFISGIREHVALTA